MTVILKVFGTIFVVFSSLGALNQPAYAIDGMASGVAEEKYSLRYCGKNRGTFTFNNFVMYSNGTWFIDAPIGTYSGTWTEANPRKPDRTFKLTFDDESWALLRDSLNNEATIMCEHFGVIHIIAGLDTSDFTAKTNKGHTKIVVMLKALTTGTTSYYLGKGKYSLKFKTTFQPN